jgi:hypothetical protein
MTYNIVRKIAINIFSILCLKELIKVLYILGDLFYW